MSPVVVEFEKAVGNFSWKIGFAPVATRWIVERSNARVNASKLQQIAIRCTTIMVK
jgi:hypothetical protein